MIPQQLQNPAFRFCLIRANSKAPYELDWQHKGYVYDDTRLIDHIKSGGNYGVIGGCGNLRIIDIDVKNSNYKATAERIRQALQTFEVRTGSGGSHFYVLSDYGTNHIFLNGAGEFRANNYQVVGPGCVHPNGNRYEVAADLPIREVPTDKVRELLAPLLRPEKPQKPEAQDTPNPEQRDNSRSGREFGEVCSFIRQGKDKATVFKAMQVFAKWSSAPAQYREITYANALSATTATQHHPPQPTTTQSNPAQLDDNVLKLLDEPELQTAYLDIGYTDTIFYYGFTLAGKEAIITSDKRILRNTLEKIKTDGEARYIGENQIKNVVNYSGYLGDIAPTISRQSIKNFLTSTEKLNPREVYDAVKAKIEYYMDFSDRPEIADVETCWVIATHIYPLFHWFPHLLFNAPSDSGKTKNANVLLYLSFRGFDLGASAGVTPAQIFRTLEGNRGTILIDEFEKNDKSETQMLVNQILNASASRDAYVIRTEQIDKKWRAWKFPIFCPKIVCNITGINPTSMSRFIAITLLKTLDSAKSRRKPESSKEKTTFPAMRDSISLLMLQEWQNIKNIYDNEEFTLTNRDADNWQPIFAIAKWIGNDVLTSVSSYVKTYRELRLESNDLVENLFRTIYENVTDEPSYYTAKQIAAWMGDELNHQKSPASWVGWRMKQYYFKPERKDTGKSYFLSKIKVINILKRYFGTEKGSEDTEHTKGNKGSEDTGKVGLFVRELYTSEPSAVLESGFRAVFPSFELLEQPHGVVEGIPSACALCGLKRCFYIHRVTGRPYCPSCAESVEKGWEIAK